MRVLIVSDTHRDNTNLFKVIDEIGKIDMLIHLGDAEGGENHINAAIDCPFYVVKGNNDFFSDLPREKIIRLGNYNVLLTHGHYYNVSFTYDRILNEALYRNIQIVMFGHIHKPVVEKREGIVLINPGSLSYPRQANRRPSYIIMDIDDDGEPEYTIKYI